MQWRWIALVATIAATMAASAPNAAQAKSASSHVPPVVVRGGFVNDASCVPAGAPSVSGGGYVLDCFASSLWDGDLTGRTVAHYVGTLAEDGSFAGDYDERFTGRYVDGSSGTLRTKGHFSIDPNGQFIARAEIVGGSCAWEGSTGSMAYDGYELNGGYVGAWIRPRTPATAAATACVPADGVPS